jgi:hypothetical protein
VNPSPTLFTHGALPRKGGSKKRKKEKEKKLTGNGNRGSFDE